MSLEKIEARDRTNRPLDLAWRAVDAEGGSHPEGDELEAAYAKGYDEALTRACAAIEKLGGRPS